VAVRSRRFIRVRALGGCAASPYIGDAPVSGAAGLASQYGCVEREVAPEQARRVGVRDRGRARGLWVGGELEERLRAVGDRDAALPRRRERWDRAAPDGQRRERGRREVRHRRAIDVERVALAVGVHRVDEPGGLVARERGLEAGAVGRARHREVLIDHAEVPAGDVADRVGVSGVPAELRVGEHRSMVRAVDAALALDERAVRLLDREHELAAGQRADLVAVAIARGIAIDEIEPVDHEAARGRERVGPREIAVEADADAGEPEEVRAVDVERARDRQVSLVEAQLALPRKVRVRDQHAASGRRAIGADRPAVRARGIVALRRARRDLALCGARGRRLRGGDRVEEEPGGADDAGLEDVGKQIDIVDRADPRGVRAVGGPRTGRRRGEVAVVAGREAAEDGAGVARQRRQAAPRLAVDVECEPAEVALDVGVALPGAEQRGALAAQLDDLVGEHADVLRRERVALSVREAAEVRRDDVWDAVRGPADRGAVRRCRRHRCCRGRRHGGRSGSAAGRREYDDRGDDAHSESANTGATCDAERSCASTIN
jgi:hypothetical protein